MKSVTSNHRRILLLGLAGLVGCDQISEAIDMDGSWSKLSDEDKALGRKLRGLRGGELIVDAFGEKHGVNIFDETGTVFYKSATLSAFNNSRHSYSAHFGVPKTLLAEWRDGASEFRPHQLTGAYDGGVVIAQYTVPVASRIPQEVLNAVRNKQGGFRLKIRLHDDGLLIGWDLATGFRQYALAGGDFREAEIENGKAVRKGWYIDPKTKERIETDF